MFLPPCDLDLDMHILLFLRRSHIMLVMAMLAPPAFPPRHAQLAEGWNERFRFIGFRPVQQRRICSLYARSLPLALINCGLKEKLDQLGGKARDSVDKDICSAVLFDFGEVEDGHWRCRIANCLYRSMQCSKGLCFSIIRNLKGGD